MVTTDDVYETFLGKLVKVITRRGYIYRGRLHNLTHDSIVISDIRLGHMVIARDVIERLEEWRDSK